MKGKKLYQTLLFSFFWLTSSYGSDRYFLCGPDEDGCYPEIYQYCSCTPYDDLEATKAYCLDFDKMICIPLSKKTDCPASFTYNNQGECLAVILQSEPTPPCQLTTHAFCLEHHTFFCAPDGQPESCH